MRRALITTLGFVASTLFVLPATPAQAASGVVLPYKTPPGSVVAIDVMGCPAGTTTTIVIDVVPLGGAAVLDRSAAASPEGGALFDVKLPIDLAPGPHQVRISCKDQDATTIDTGVIDFEVAILPVSVTPASGPAGTTVTVSGSGCPTGLTDRVFSTIVGASDDDPVWNPATAEGPGALPNEDGSFRFTKQVPANAPTGENSVIIFCVSEGGSAIGGPGFGVFNVTEGTIPAVGGWSLEMAVLALAVAALGVVLLVVGHRRRQGAA